MSEFIQSLLEIVCLSFFSNYWEKIFMIQEVNSLISSDICCISQTEAKGAFTHRSAIGPNFSSNGNLAN